MKTLNCTVNFQERDGHAEIMLSSRVSDHGGTRRNVHIIRIDDPVTIERLRTGINLMGGKHV